MATASSKKSLADLWVSGFDLSDRRKYTLKDAAGNEVADVYFRPITRSDRLVVNSRANSDDALKISTQMLVHKAENEDGSKAFNAADAVKLQRELPEEQLNEIEVFLFGAGDEPDLEEIKNG
tara:strand:+ start:2862 stop:3227 length:366 start_codon:yes stop_codon:yes gene_type:complete